MNPVLPHMFQGWCTAQMLPTATTAKATSYSVPILTRPLNEIILAPVYKMHAATGVTDAWSALWCIPDYDWHRFTVQSRNVHLHSVKTMYFQFMGV